MRFTKRRYPHQSLILSMAVLSLIAIGLIVVPKMTAAKLRGSTRDAVGPLASMIVPQEKPQLDYGRIFDVRATALPPVVMSGRSGSIGYNFFNINFDGSPGTAAPPATLGPYSMISFPNDPRANGSLVTTVPTPAAAGLSALTFSHSLQLAEIGAGWATWSHGYTGDVYHSGLMAPPERDAVTINLPTGTKAFYFYAEPDSLGSFTITATANDGTTSGPILVTGASGARYFGFYISGGNVELLSILVTADPAAGGFAIGEFAIAPAQADLSIAKTTDNASPVNGGAFFSYTLTVTNNGPDVAQDVVVTDALPQGILFGSATPSAGSGFSCTGPPVGTNGIVSCSNPSFNLGVATITIVAQSAAAQAGGVRTNTATVTSATNDPGPGVNTSSVVQTLAVSAPLSITKAGPATVSAGDIFTYHITVNNGGSSTALNATISDPLPPNTTFLNLSGTGAFDGTCSHNGGSPGTVTCAAVDIPSGVSTLDITVRLSPSAPSGPLGNTATITTAGTGTIAVGNSTTTATVIHTTDLGITKVSNPASVAPGQTLTYTITVTNTGPSDTAAGEVVVNDAPFPPTGTTLVGVITAPGFSCHLSVVFPCTATAPISAGANATIQFSVQVNPDVTASQISNTATVGIVPGSDAVDPVSSNNSSTAVTQLVPSADLGVVKTALTVAGGVFGAAVTAGGGVLPGFGIGNVGLGEIEYTLAYSNAGPSDASNVHIRDVIPAGTLLVPTFLPIGVVVTPTAGPGLTCQILPTLNEYQLDCTPNTAGGVLPNGSAGTIQFSVRVPENILEGAVIKNQATINSEPSAPVNGDLAAALSTADPNSGNNTSLETQNIVRTSADLSITKVAPDDVQAGNTINYVLQVTNNGVSDAQDVVVKDTLPAGVSFVSATSPNGSVSCSHDGGVVTCTLATLIAPAINPPPIIPARLGSNIFDITIVGLVDPALAAGTALSNTATVSASTQDPVPANNTASDGTTVTTQAVVTIVKSDSPDPVVAGTNLTYTISVNNAGPSNALNLVVTDTLPADTSFVSISGTGVFANAGACTHNGAVPGAITCNGGSFAPGAQTITVVVKVDSDYPSGTISNTAVVAWQDTNGAVGAQVDQTAMDSESTAVIRQADLALDKSSSGGPWIAGTNVDFTIKLTNNGPSDVFGGTTPGSIVVTDTLPAGSTLANIPNNVVVAGPGGFTCTQTNGTVTCLNAAGAPGNFPAGAMTTIILKLTIASSIPAGSNFCNTATVAIDPAVVIAVDVDPDLDAVDPNLGNNTDTACVIVTTSADLGLSKTALPVVDPDGAGPLVAVALPVAPAGAVNAGGYIRYDVPFANAGPSDSINVTLTDAPPGNTAFVGALTVGGVFVPAAQPPAVPFNFTIGALDATNQAIVLACTVLGAPGSQQLRCSPADNTAVDPAYGEGILPAGAFGTLTFFVQVNPSVLGGTVVHNSANITSGPGEGAPPEGPAIENGVSQTGSTPDPNASNNTSLPIPTLVVSNSQLTVTKIVHSAVTSASNPNQTGPIGPATAPNGVGITGMAVIPGTVLTYRITVTNNGPSDVHNVQLTDILPAGQEFPPGRVLGVRYVSVNPVLPSPLTWVCAPPTGINPANNPQSNGGSLQCTSQGGLSAVAPNNTTAIDVVVFIDAATKVNIVNTATVNATTNGFNQPVSGTAILTTPIAATSDLALTKTHTTPVVAGLEFNYTVTLTNNGPSAAQMVSMVDSLPLFQTVTNISIAQSPNGNGAPSFSCVTAGSPQVVTCTAAELPPNKNADGTVNPAGTVVFTIRVLQSASTPQPTPIMYQNCVTATSMSTDPTPANNTNICDTVTVTFSADVLAATLKTDTPDPVIAGTLLTYTITVPNPGPSDALNTTITDPLPAGTVFISAVASPGATLTTPAVNTNGTVIATWDAAGGTPGGLTPVGTDRVLTIVVRVCPEVTCNTIITNTATASSGTPDPNMANNPGTATTTVQSRAELSISKSVEPAVVKPTQNVTYTLTYANAGPSNAASTVITDVLPAGFQVVSVVSTTPGMTFSQAVGGPTGDQVTLTINLGILGAANQCATTFPLSGTVTIVALVPSKFPNVFVTNTASIASGNCLAELNQADNTSSVTHEVATEPLFQTVGQPFPANSEASDQKAGSILFFPLYTSNASLPGSQNTRISMTNVSQTEISIVHLFVVDGTTCSAQDVFICLTPNQTITFRSSDFDPNITGYIVAIAVNPVTGIPMACNFLIGDAYVKFSSGHALNYGAVAVSALQLNPAGVDQTATQATLKFDGIHYNRLPRQLAVDGIPSPGDGNSTMIALHAVGGNMSQSGATLGSLTGNLFDDRENNYSFNSPAPNCQFRSILTDNFPRTFVPFSTAITPGHSGWMKIRAFNDVAILGVQLNFNPNTAISGTAFNMGHVLHTMTLTNSATLVVPVDFPGC